MTWMDCLQHACILAQCPRSHGLRSTATTWSVVHFTWQAADFSDVSSIPPPPFRPPFAPDEPQKAALTSSPPRLSSMERRRGGRVGVTVVMAWLGVVALHAVTGCALRSLSFRHVRFSVLAACCSSFVAAWSPSRGGRKKTLSDEGKLEDGLMRKNNASERFVSPLSWRAFYSVSFHASSCVSPVASCGAY